jgi:pectinesterase
MSSGELSVATAGIDRRRLIDPIASLDNELFSVADGFPSWLSPADRRLLQVLPSGIRANAVVAKDGSGHYKTITEAINAAPSKSNGRYIIYVRAGIYAERVKVSKDGIMLVGDGKDVTIVTGKLSGVSLKSISNFSMFSYIYVHRNSIYRNEIKLIFLMKTFHPFS